MEQPQKFSVLSEWLASLQLKIISKHYCEKKNYSKGVVIRTLEDGRIAVDVYTVMSYGVRISEVSRNIQERVKFNLENQLGISVDAVNVFIQNIKVVGE